MPYPPLLLIKSSFTSCSISLKVTFPMHKIAKNQIIKFLQPNIRYFYFINKTLTCGARSAKYSLLEINIWNWYMKLIYEFSSDIMLLLLDKSPSCAGNVLSQDIIRIFSMHLHFVIEIIHISIFLEVYVFVCYSHKKSQGADPRRTHVDRNKNILKNSEPPSEYSIELWNILENSTVFYKIPHSWREFENLLLQNIL